MSAGDTGIVMVEIAERDNDSALGIKKLEHR